MKKNSMIYKSLLLAVVCAVAGACLAAVNAVTEPVIEKNALAAVQSTLDQFFPNGDFTDVTSQYVTDEYDLVDGVYEAKNEGYVFTLHNTGYSSSGFKFAIAFSNDGSIVGYEALEQNETSGKGSLAFDQSYTDSVTKLTTSDALPLISGATVTTSAVREAASQAESIFNSIMGIEGGISSDDSSSSTTSADSGATTGATSSVSDGTGTLGTADYSSADASCTANGDGTYACKATGFSGAAVSAVITVKDGAITSIADLTGQDDGDGVGDTWYTDASVFNGATLDTTVDAISGATYTSNAVRGMAAAALNAAEGK